MDVNSRAFLELPLLEMNDKKPYPTDEQLDFIESMKKSWVSITSAIDSLDEMIEKDAPKELVLAAIRFLKASGNSMIKAFDDVQKDMSDLNH